MANPTVTIEIKAIDKNAVSTLEAVRGEAEKLVTTKKKLTAQSKQTKTNMSQLARAMKNVANAESSTGAASTVLAERLGQVGTQMGRAASSSKLAQAETKRLAIETERLANKSMRDLGARMQMMMRSRNLEIAAARKQAFAAKRLSAQQTKLAITTGRSAIMMRNLGSAAVFAVGPLSGIGARLIAFQAIAERTNLSIAAFAAGLAAFVVVAVKVIGASIRASLAFQKIMSALTVATGSAFAAKEAFEFVSEASLNLGLNLEQSAEQFAQLSAAAKGTSLEGEGIRKVFLGSSKAAVALGLSVEQTTGIFRALQQMISKGTVQAEELRGQLGERLPGAFQIAAIAMGVTTQELGKLLKAGKVLAEDLLPKLGEEFEKRFAEQAKIASQNLRSAMNRLSTSTFLFSLELDKVVQGGRAATGVLDTLSSVVLTLKENMASLVSVVVGISAAFGVMAAPAIIRGLAKIFLWIKRLTAGVFALGIAISSTPVGLFITLGRVAAAALAGTIAFFAFKKSLEETSVSQLELINHLKDYIEVVKEAEGATSAAIDVQVREAERGIAASLVALTAAKLALLEVQEIQKKIPRTSMLDPFGMAFESSAVDLTKEQETVKRLSGEYNTLLEILKELQGLSRVSIAEAASEELAKIELQVEAMERLNAARRNGKTARLAEIQQLDLEKELRKLNVSATSDQGIALAALIARKHEALAVTKALTEEERNSLRIAKKLEAARDKITKLKEKGQEEITSLMRANEVLELRIAGLDEEARLMEIRNQLEEKYGGELLRKTREELEKIILKNDELKKKLKEVNEFQQVLSDHFKSLGGEIASAIREGKSIVDVLINSFGNLLEKLLEVAIQLLIIGPLLKSMGLPGGTASPATLFGFSTNILGLPTFGAAHGADFTVKGKGGVDANLVPLALTAGEHVQVTPANQNGGDKQTIINFNFPPGTGVREFGDSQSQIAVMVANTMSAASQGNS